MGWDEMYAESQNGVTGVEGSTYRVKIEAARIRAQSRLIFLDLEILAGPLTGKRAQVNIWLPKAGDPNSGYHFSRKIGGFGDLSQTFAAMALADPDGSNIEGALTLLATALVDKVVDATLELVTDGGKYDGTNNLILTTPVDDGAPLTVSVARATADQAAAEAVATPVVAATAGLTAPVKEPF